MLWGFFFSGRDWETSQDRGKDEQSKVQRDPWWKPAPECSGPQTGAKVSECPWWEAQTENLWRDLKIAVQQCSPSNLTDLERICIEEWEILPKYRYAKPVASYPRRLEAVIAAKGASTKYLVKGLNIGKCDISVHCFNFFWQAFLKTCLFCHYGVLCIDWWGGNIYWIHFRLRL